MDRGIIAKNRLRKDALCGLIAYGCTCSVPEDLKASGGSTSPPCFDDAPFGFLSIFCNFDTPHHRICWTANGAPSFLSVDG